MSERDYGYLGYEVDKDLEDMILDLLCLRYSGMQLTKILYFNKIKSVRDMEKCETPQLPSYSGKRSLGMFRLVRERLISFW